jgi:hypothetical protein
VSCLSFAWPVLTEMHLCHSCSCQGIPRVGGHGVPGMLRLSGGASKMPQAATQRGTRLGPEGPGPGASIGGGWNRAPPRWADWLLSGACLDNSSSHMSPLIIADMHPPIIWFGREHAGGCLAGPFGGVYSTSCCLKPGTARTNDGGRFAPCRRRCACIQRCTRR